MRDLNRSSNASSTNTLSLLSRGKISTEQKNSNPKKENPKQSWRRIRSKIYGRNGKAAYFFLEQSENETETELIIWLV